MTVLTGFDHVFRLLPMVKCPGLAAGLRLDEAVFQRVAEPSGEEVALRGPGIGRRWFGGLRAIGRLRAGAVPPDLVRP